tara:strand:- start:2627 stop:3505 length:879 start_codon:yes stop_codon:yes gene_type:complete
MKPIYIALALIVAAQAQLPAPTAEGSIVTVKEMLVTGPPQMKMHSLAMITQGNIKGGIDASYLDAFTTCANDPMPPIRSITARIIGQHFIQHQETPHPRALDLLLKLSQDDSSDVRFSAVVHGLCKLNHFNQTVLDTLIQVALQHREATLLEAIKTALTDNPQLKARLQQQLNTSHDIACFELYHQWLGTLPPNPEAYLDLPSSRPKLIVFTPTNPDLQSAASELQRQLTNLDIPPTLIQPNDPNAAPILMLKTYITREYIELEKTFKNHEQFPITQTLWLTPEIELQLETF